MFANHTNEALVEAGKAWFAEAEARLTADGNQAEPLRLTKRAHATLDMALGILIGGGVLPASSGDKDPEGGG